MSTAEVVTPRAMISACARMARGRQRSCFCDWETLRTPFETVDDVRDEYTFGGAGFAVSFRVYRGICLVGVDEVHAPQRVENPFVAVLVRQIRNRPDRSREQHGVLQDSRQPAANVVQFNL